MKTWNWHLGRILFRAITGTYIMVTGIGLISGGLDSMLAARLLQDQDIHVIGISFVTPFFGSKRAERAAAMINMELRIMDITELHLEIVKSPKYGYGKGMNPCIDCHTLMFREAGKVMEAEGADFLFSGEVLGERPMSQNRQSLMIVAKQSGYQDFIIRPLSARLLPETLPEREGKVDRERLLDISGRSRKPQIELAAHYGTTEYPQPAGGCLLTEPGYSRRLRELMEHSPILDARDIQMLRIGRHFRLDTGEKVIVGRDKDENEKILALKDEEDITLRVKDYPSPITIIPCSASQDAIAKAASICVRYSDAPHSEGVVVTYRHQERIYTLTAETLSQEELEIIRI
jgi:tRNA-specific 2-thiouridylase